MTTIPGEFDGSEEERGERPLPPEDRFWRHPSELDPVRLDPDAIRRRWLLSHPSHRRSILTAGLVGALLASGIAAMVTHLADSMSASGHPGAVDTSLNTTAPANTGGTAVVSAPLESSIAKVSQAMVTVDVAKSGHTIQALGVVIRSNGMLLVPAAGIAGASSLIVTLANGDVYVGYLVGTDSNSGLSVLRINGASGLSTITFSRVPITSRSLILAITSPGQRYYELGTVLSTNATVRVAGRTLVDAVSTDLTASAGPLGSPLLSSTGAVEGIVTAASGDSSVIAPAWLAAAVSQDLMMSGSVVHGWLGIRCETNIGHPSGVRILSVSTQSPLAKSGLRSGAVIVAVDRMPVSTLAQLRSRLYAMAPGSEVTLAIEQSGRMSNRAVTLAASPSK